MSTGAEIEFGDLIREARGIVGENQRLVLLILVTMATGYTAVDLISERANLAVGIVVGIYGQYLFLEKVLDAADNGRRRFSSMFGSNFLSGLAVLFGLVLLVFPGLYLAARWALAPASVVADDQGATSSLSASWNATRQCWQPLLWAYLLFGTVWIVLVIGAGMTFGLMGMGLGHWWQSAIINLLSVMFILSNWLIGAAGYRLVGGPQNSLDAVFA